MNDKVTQDGGNAQPESNQQEQQQVNAGAIRKSTTQNILSALSQVSDNDFNSVEDAIQFIAQLKSKPSGGNDQPKQVETPEPKQTQNTSQESDLQEQFQMLKKQLEQKERNLAQEKLDRELIGVMGDKFDSDLRDYALQKIKANIKLQNGEPVIVDKQGRQRYGSDGNPLTIESLVNEVAEGNPKLLKQAVNSGSGLRPQGNFAGAPLESVPDYSRDPAAFNAWAQARGLGKGVGLKGTSVSATVSGGSKKIL